MYRFCRYRRGVDGQIVAKIFELEEKGMLGEYLKTEPPGWYKHHKDVPDLSDDDPIALDLLNGEGLNLSSYTRAIFNKADPKSKKAAKPSYDKIIAHFGDRIYKQNKDWFLNADNNS